MKATIIGKIYSSNVSRRFDEPLFFTLLTPCIILISNFGNQRMHIKRLIITHNILNNSYIFRRRGAMFREPKVRNTALQQTHLHTPHGPHRKHSDVRMHRRHVMYVKPCSVAYTFIYHNSEVISWLYSFNIFRCVRKITKSNY